jgi:hypothetical protein
VRSSKFVVSFSKKERKENTKRKKSGAKRKIQLVGYAGFEPATSPLSGVRSDQLS